MRQNKEPVTNKSYPHIHLSEEESEDAASVILSGAHATPEINDCPVKEATCHSIETFQYI